MLDDLGLPLYRFNLFHKKHIEQAIDNLREHQLLKNLELEYDLYSLFKIEEALRRFFLKNGNFFLKKIDPDFENNLLILIGEIYMRSNNEGEWVSTEEKFLIPYGIIKEEKISTRFTTLMYDIMHDYPYNVFSDPVDVKLLFNFSIMLKYIDKNF